MKEGIRKKMPNYKFVICRYDRYTRNVQILEVHDTLQSAVSRSRSMKQHDIADWDYYVEKAEDRCFKSDVAETPMEKSLKEEVSKLSTVIAEYRRAFNAIWDSATGVMTQEQIDLIQEIHKEDFEVFDR